MTKLIDYNFINQIQEFNSHICYKASQTEIDYFMFILKKLSVCKDTEIQTHLRLLALSSLFVIKNNLSAPAPPAWLTEFVEKINSPQYFSYSINQLYKLAPYSQSQLSLLFKKFFNTTLVNYVTNVKIEYACCLLENKTFSILQISKLAGFSSLSTFNHVFKKLKKCSPSEYKAKYSIQ